MPLDFPGIEHGNADAAHAWAAVVFAADAEVQTQRGFRLTTLGDMLREPEEKCEWVIAGMLPAAGLSLLAAKPKVGKSTLARCLALAVSRGADFLGRATQSGSVIYLALEEKRSEVRAHFRALGADGSEPIFIHAATAPADALLLIADELKSRKPALLIIDPLLRFTRLHDGNDYAQVTNALEPLLGLARTSGTHVMLIHHLGKGERAEPTDGILGSTALFAAVDTAIIMRRTERYRTIQSRQRYGTDMAETVLTFDPASRAIGLGVERNEADGAAAANDILACLQSETDGKTEDQILEGAEGRTGMLRKALRQLVAEGKVLRVGTGRKGSPYTYTAPNDDQNKCSFSRSPYISGTRERESEKQAEPRVNTDAILVPDHAAKAILVPGINGVEI